MKKDKEYDLNIGDIIRIGRTDYTIVGKFEDVEPGRRKKSKFYVGRKTTSWSFSYSNIITWDNEHGKFMLRT